MATVKEALQNNGCDITIPVLFPTIITSRVMSVLRSITGLLSVNFNTLVKLIRPFMLSTVGILNAQQQQMDNNNNIITVADFFRAHMKNLENTENSKARLVLIVLSMVTGCSKGPFEHWQFVDTKNATYSTLHHIPQFCPPHIWCEYTKYPILHILLKNAILQIKSEKLSYITQKTRKGGEKAIGIQDFESLPLIVNNHMITTVQNTQWFSFTNSRFYLSGDFNYDRVTTTHNDDDALLSTDDEEENIRDDQHQEEEEEEEDDDQQQLPTKATNKKKMSHAAAFNTTLLKNPHPQDTANSQRSNKRQDKTSYDAAAATTTTRPSTTRNKKSTTNNCVDTKPQNKGQQKKLNAVTNTSSTVDKVLNFLTI